MWVNDMLLSRSVVSIGSFTSRCRVVRAEGHASQCETHTDRASTCASRRLQRGRRSHPRRPHNFAGNIGNGDRKTDFLIIFVFAKFQKWFVISIQKKRVLHLEKTFATILPRKRATGSLIWPPGGSRCTPQVMFCSIAVVGL